MRRLLLLVPLVGCVFLSNVAAAEPVPISSIFEKAQLDLPRLSPGGQRLVMVTGTTRERALTLFDVGTRQTTVLALFKDADIANLWWKGEHRLLMLVDDERGRTFRILNVDERKVVEFANLQSDLFKSLIDELPVDPENVLVASTRGDLYRFNVFTGKLKRLEKAPPHEGRWILNRQKEPVGVVAIKDQQPILQWRSDREGPWQVFALGPVGDWDFLVHGLHADDRRFLVTDRTVDGPSRLVALDPASGANEVLFVHPEVDLFELTDEGHADRRLRGVRFETDRPQYHFFDDADARLHAMIDQALPKTANQVVSQSADSQRAVILAISDQAPARYLLLDRGKNQIALLGTRERDYEKYPLGGSRWLQFAARDGLPLHGRLRLPPSGGSPPPLVVIVDRLSGRAKTPFELDPFGQIFASRGFAVARFDLRGSAGFGRAFLRAGDYQIKEGIPNDLEDGVRWLAAQGLIDPTRVAILGISDGGLLALNAIARPSTPFTVWLNLNTPMSRDWLDYDDFAMSARNWRESVADLGGLDDARHFREATIPDALVPLVRIPSCHYYLGGDLKARSLLKKSPAPSRMIESRPYADKPAVSAEIARGLGEMVDFLVAHFAVKAP